MSRLPAPSLNGGGIRARNFAGPSNQFFPRRCIKLHHGSASKLVEAAQGLSRFEPTAATASKGT